jgi:ABC-2 family transporter protein
MMFTFLIPLYYMVSKLAEEKESKSREGMKMMGLKDSTYFLSWMTTFGVVIALMSLLLTIMVSFSTFRQSNKILFFLFNFIYGISLFGFSVVIVALLPTQRSSSLAASLLHVITFFIVFAIADPNISSSVKIGLSVFPNVGMALGFFNLFHFEY